MGRGGKFPEFKPARRVFAGRGRSMLTFGEWKIAAAGILFGGAVGAGWFHEFTPGASPLTLVQPAPVAIAAPAAPENASALAPTIVAETALEPAPEEILPQIVLAAADGRTSRRPEPAYYIASVARVVDGDTFYLEGITTRIRLWGVDAPERSEEGFDEASEMLATLVAEQPLACEHVDIDPHERIVARCYFGDGRDLSEAMIRSGVADEYLRFTRGYYGGE